MAPLDSHVEPLCVPDVSLQPAGGPLSPVVLSQQVLWSPPPPPAWLLDCPDAVINDCRAALVPLVNMRLSQSPRQSLGVVTDCPSPHPPGDLLARQLPSGDTFTDFIAEELDLRTPASKEPSDLELLRQTGSFVPLCVLHFSIILSFIRCDHVF